MAAPELPDAPAAPPAQPALQVDAEAPAAHVGDPIALLSPMERFAFRLVAFANRSGGIGLSHVWQHHILPAIFENFIGRRLVIHGLERVRAIPAGTSILLVANHRSFFDLFVLGWIFERLPGTRRTVNFPVRANFFYENPLGLLICLLLSGGTMFPPFFRDKKKRPFNLHSLQILVEKLRAPGSMVGFHPEGTRNQGDDPYVLLRAQPGAGELALKARPVVLPAFVNGLTNSVWAELKANWRRERPIVAVFGEPMVLPEDTGETRLSQHKRLADQMLDRIRELGEVERDLRARLPAGPVKPTELKRS